MTFDDHTITPASSADRVQDQQRHHAEGNAPQQRRPAVDAARVADDQDDQQDAFDGR
jgi:hypothetical protein